MFLKFCCFLKKDCIYWFLENRKGKERRRETSMCGCLSSIPYWGPGPQPRHMPWLGIKPVTLWFTVRYSVHWAIAIRANILKILGNRLSGSGFQVIDLEPFPLDHTPHEFSSQGENRISEKGCSEAHLLFLFLWPDFKDPDIISARQLGL